MPISKKSIKKKQYKAQKDKKKYINKYASERTPITNQEIVCKHCNFKTQYEFLRCPECGKTRE